MTADLANIRVDAIADRHIHEPVLPTNRHRRLGAFLRQRKQTRSGAASHDYGKCTIRSMVLWRNRAHVFIL